MEIEKILAHEQPSRFIYAPNYWQWFRHQVSHNKLPDEIRHCNTLLDLYNHLGVDIFSRNIYSDPEKYWFGGLCDEVLDGFEIFERRTFAGKDKISSKQYISSLGILDEKLTYFFNESTLVQTKFLIGDYVRDFELFRNFLANRRWEFNTGKFNNVSRSVGEKGIVIAGEFFGPLKMFHFTMGPVNTVYFLMEYPEKAKELVQIHEEAQLRCIEQTVKSGVRVIMSMDNLDTMFHPPDYVQEYSSSYYKKASDLCHAYGAKFFIHACGQQKDNLKLISSYGVDGLEGVASPPLGDVMLDEAMNDTRDGFIITGGISAMETRDLKTKDEIFDYVEKLFRKMLPYKNRFIFSSSCNTAIDTRWETIKHFRDAWLAFRWLLILIAVTMIPCISLIAQQPDYETYGVKDDLPVFYEKLAERQVYPLSWLQGDKGDFSIWRNEARAKVMECLLTPPPVVPFNPVVISEQDRGSYVARKIVLNITGDSRVLGFMLVPKTKGPHPAVLLLHDHGAKFDIGKEKVIEPWDEPAEKIASAKEYVKLCYGGRFIGDELAKKGYVCFATDMLNWSDREGGGYKVQQALASNLFNLGVSFAGLIAYEDLYAAEFISQQPEVDPKRIAAMGLSVGGFRTWQIAALSEHISAGVSVCWMSTYKALMVPGNNMVGGNSAYTMVHPGLSHYLDYPDVASIACPKPMMFCCGNKDDLFPLESIKEAFKKMRMVWESQNAGDKLVTNLYDSPHEFNISMQTDAFEWLDKILKNNK